MYVTSALIGSCYEIQKLDPENCATIDIIEKVNELIEDHNKILHATNDILNILRTMKK